jgi:hypothetical protein
MGVELHITRAEEFYFDNENTQITSEEWLSYVETDPELELCQNQGSYFTKWLGESTHEDPWLDWFDGNIHSKWPDTALYHKMLKIAKALNAKIQDDDCKLYLTETDWDYDPAERHQEIYQQTQKSSWWKRLLGK